MEENRYQHIIQFLEGTISATAEKNLAQWRKNHPDNEQYFQEVKFLWQKMPLVKKQQIPLNINTTSALEKVHQQLPPVAKVVPLRKRIAPFVAAATILFLTGFFAWSIFLKPVEMIHIATLDNETKQVTLPDQSIVWLNENSTLSYPTHFNEQQRQIKMSGDLVFDITHKLQQPFVVHTKNLAVTVLGTKFNVIDKEETTTASWVYVLDGKVQVQKQATLDKKVILEKGMAAALNHKSNQLLATKSFAVNQLFWYHHTLTFDQTSLQNALETINQAYGTDVELTNQSIFACPFTGTFKGKSLLEVLETLQLIYGFEINHIDSLSPQLNKGKCQ